VSPLDHIPQIGDRPGVEDAMELIVTAVEAMEPDGQLAERWDEYRDAILNWAKREEPIPPQALHGLRLGLEGMAGDSETGELLIAATKCCMSAILGAIPNIYCILLPDRDPMHDDVAPLIEKGFVLLHKAAALEPFDPIVRVDYSIPERLEAKKAFYVEEAEQAAKKNWVSELIDNAVRPESMN
jgi:hypothetical protein